MATVSIVIPCFNLGAYLVECVESVLGQTYPDFEIIIVDDGSTDPETRNLLASYAPPKTRVIRTPNQGLAKARNIGLQEATGRYVSFLDADDLLSPTFLERTVAVLDSVPSFGFASCWLKAFGATHFDWTPTSCDFPHLLAECTVCSAALTRRDALLKLKGYDAGMPVAGYEDWELSIRLVAAGFRGVIIPEFLFNYRIRKGSMSASCTAPHNHSRLMAYLLDKHPGLYKQHFDGVMLVIERRLQQVEERLPYAPVRPDLKHDDGRQDSWRDRLLLLENHRRNVEVHLQLADPNSERESRRQASQLDVTKVQLDPVPPNFWGWYVDLPKVGASASLNSLRIIGWALPKTGCVKKLHVFYNGHFFKSLSPGKSRPDLARAFPQVVHADQCGFDDVINLSGANETFDLELHAVLEDNSTGRVGSISARRKPTAAPRVSLILPPGASRDFIESINYPELQLIELVAEQAEVAPSLSPTAVPVLVAKGQDWLSSILEHLKGDFVSILAEQPDSNDLFFHHAIDRFLTDDRLAFASACGSSPESPKDALPRYCTVSGVLSGQEIGYPLIFRKRALDSIHGLDSSFEFRFCQWDLCIRLMARGEAGIVFPSITTDNYHPSAWRVDSSESFRRLHDKHRQLYGRHLISVILDQEDAIARLLRGNYGLENDIALNLRPEIARRHEELNALRLKLACPSLTNAVTSGQSGAETPFRWGDFRRLQPVSPVWGSDRGLCIDRFYIERFLQQHAADIRGRVLEVHDSIYALRYGGGQVTHADVIDINPLNPQATIVDDLSQATTIPDSSYDCIILTQTLCLIPDVAAVLNQCRRILKPNGVLLSTEPCINRIDPDAGVDGDFWRFTPTCIANLFAECFGPASFQLVAHGNRLISLAFLQGLAAHELPTGAIEDFQPSFPLTITVRAVAPHQKLEFSNE